MASLAAETSALTQEASRSAYDRVVTPFFTKHCQECHGEKLAEKELNLAKLDPDMKASTSAARWAVVLTQLTSGKMPPKDQPRPAGDEVAAVTKWIAAEMKRAGKHVAAREAYANGNAVDHTLLFDPNRIGEFDAPAGVRRLSPQIYSAFTNELGKGLSGIGQPFSSGGKTTFKDMGAPTIDEPTTAQLIRNALLIVEQKLTAYKIENDEMKGLGGAQKQFLRLMDDEIPPSDAEVATAVKHMFDLVLKRQPQEEELDRFARLYQQGVKDAGRIKGARYMLAAVLLLPEAVFRLEQGAGDGSGRLRLSPREIAFAISYTLTDRRPETWLLKLAETGELDTEAGVVRATEKILDDPKLAKPRLLRFFQEYFQYTQAEEVFKDNKAYPDHDPRALIEDTDRLVLDILEADKDVLFELLTTNKSYVAHKSAAETKKRRAEEVAKFEAEKSKDPKKYETKKPPKSGRSIYEAYNLTDFPDEQPVELPADERAGILTQPSWLAAFSKSDENHAILRGKWVRERLLGNVVPDLPITVDAQLPNAPEKTLRERMQVTHEEYCWQCHRYMNQVGYPFEIYDHLGRYRRTERVLDLEATAANVDSKGNSKGGVFCEVELDSSGAVNLTGDERIEAEATDAVQMLRHLARSERVEQVFVRHAFRYFLGRNETPGDAASLQAAHRAYRDSGGSMRSLIIALLSSESHLYRLPVKRTPVEPSVP